MRLPENVKTFSHIARPDDCYSQVDLTASSIRVIRGLKIKSVEALCKGKALIKKSISAESIKYDSGNAYLLFELASEMAAEVVRLVQNRETPRVLANILFSSAGRVFSHKAAISELHAFLKISSELDAAIARK